MSRKTTEGVIKLAFAGGQRKIMEPEQSSLPTVHENPEWMSNLKKNFFRDIIEPCSIRTKTAVVNNEDVKVKINCRKNSKNNFFFRI